MGISHLAVNLSLGNQSGHGVHNHDVHGTGTHHGLGNLQSLLAVIRLGDIQVINIHSYVPGIYRIQGMLCVNEACNAPALLHLCHHVQGDRGLTGRLRSIYLYNPALGNSAQSQGYIQADGAGGHCLNIHICSGIPQLHDGSFSVCLLNLGQGSV